ncbi:MAG: hypothetical protein O3B47_04190 [bacterium]|nr:hypothetical protein [bacterium]
MIESTVTADVDVESNPKTKVFTSNGNPANRGRIPPKNEAMILNHRGNDRFGSSPMLNIKKTVNNSPRINPIQNILSKNF